jgi:3'-phosphoadenosine 5'-phosphosulfate sulfotransferase (PAPS reductase)/FAD synthetase
MSKTAKQVLGISGGKDSAALAIYLHQKYPYLPIEYYTSDTGKELEETYRLIKNLETHLGEKITILKAYDGSEEKPFDHELRLNGNFLPSPKRRWCTIKLKIEPFEQYIGDEAPTISYVGIRGDEEREGYVSTKRNIQSIFPFRKNIWSEEITMKFLGNANLKNLIGYYEQFSTHPMFDRMMEMAQEKLSLKFNQKQKLNALLDLGIKEYNKAMFDWLKTTDYPLAYVDINDFPLIENEDVLKIDDIFRLLNDSGVGVPKYYQEMQYEVNGKTGVYNRSRSGCFFCFYQQRIEWIWLYEQHPDKFAEAMEYEKDGYTWIEGETLAELIKPARIQKIKEEHLKKTEKIAQQKKSSYLLDILEEQEQGCASCFI